MTVYLGRAADERIKAAQVLVDLHVTYLPTGRCVTCGRAPPCATLDAAVAILQRYGRLPHRRPGATRPDRLAAPFS